MVALGAATSVNDYEGLKAWFKPLYEDAECLAKASCAAKEYTSKHQGATEIIVKSIFS